MTTERLDVSDVLGPSPGYAYGARVSGGTTVYCAGAVPVDPEGNLIGRGDLQAQTQAVLANLRAVLDRANAAPADVVKTTIFVAGQQREDLPEVWRAFAQTPFVDAPSTLVGVTHLGYEGQLVEIEAIAVTDG
ncbi:MAG: RidA family protein [Actinomycetota bacterium]|nr:RidA family protein [Actinomycetota bacterium]